ncbi:MAG: hypothetical protein HY870_18800 [Chloroflexi bacterium]|nr:hypothetical protein [Chloroflexota bacterium]
MTNLSITLTGVCVAYDFRALLLTGDGALDVAERSKWAIVAQGEVPLTLGVALFDRPFIFTPMRIVTERQLTIDGERVFDWLAEQGYAMPRSEVFGRNVRGREAQIFARDIDLEASPIAICDYGNWVVGIVAIESAAPDEPQPLDRSMLPDRFRRAVRAYRAGPGINLQQLL